MAEYVIEFPHEPDEHDRIVASVLRMAPGAQRTFLWGCRAGVHKAWAFVEAAGQGEALDTLPERLKPRASVTRVEQLTPAEVLPVWEEAA
jgi:hypothetical protein